MKRTMKATDIFSDFNPVFGAKVTFKEAFPNIESVTVDVVETDEYGDERRMTYFETDLGQFIDCSRDRCYNGGFDIGKEIRRLYSAKLTEGNGEMSCQGRDGTPKGKYKGESCDHRFTFSINIVYKI
jgi:hypothetical protein